MTAKSYTRTEELANSVTHGFGLGISVVGAVVLVALTTLRGDPWQIFSSGVYGVSLVALYTASTLYHSFRPPEIKRVLRVFDHCAIYLLIAGSYTPFALVSLRGGWGWTLFGLVWGLAAAGIIFKVFFTGRLNALSTDGLRADGLAGRSGGEADNRDGPDGGAMVARRRRHHLHCWYGLLPQPACPLLPRHLAPFRHRRQCVPLLRHLTLHTHTGGIGRSQSSSTQKSCAHRISPDIRRITTHPQSRYTREIYTSRRKSRMLPAISDAYGSDIIL